MLDLVLRGGRVCDGSGGSAHDADVGIEAGRVVAIGRTGGAARRTLDVRGLIVAPGFVDVHTHYDAQVTWDRLCTPSCWHGVTSVVIGNCGFALAPCRPSERERLLRMLEHVEGMPFESLCAGIAWEWESFAEYVRALGARPLGVNVGALLGHSALRAYVMGDDAYARQARTGEVEAMAALVREGMAAGAVGLATSRSPAHVGEGGRPVPSRQASREELGALVAAMAASGRGVLEITSETFPVSADELAWLQDLARASGRPVSFSAILDVPDRRDAWEPVYARLREGLAAGAAVYPQVSCRPMRFDLDLATGCASLDAMPCWRRWRAAPSDAARLVLLADADFRAAVKARAVRRRHARRDRRRARRGRDRRAPRALRRRGPARALLDAARELRRGPRGHAARPPREPDRALRRGRARLGPLRRRLRDSPPRPLGARARPLRLGGGGPPAHCHAGGDLRHPGARAPGARAGGRRRLLRSGAGRGARAGEGAGFPGRRGPLRRARRGHRARLHRRRGVHGAGRVDGGVPGHGTRRRHRALSRACPSPGRPACSRLTCSTSPASPSATEARSSSTTSPGACPTARWSGSPARTAPASRRFSASSRARWSRTGARWRSRAARASATCRSTSSARPVSRCAGTRSPPSPTCTSWKRAARASSTRSPPSRPRARSTRPSWSATGPCATSGTTAAATTPRPRPRRCSPGSVSGPPTWSATAASSRAGGRCAPRSRSSSSGAPTSSSSTSPPTTSTWKPGRGSKNSWSPIRARSSWSRTTATSWT